MRVHDVRKIEVLKKLRKSGHSINELVRLLSIPKTTVWHHVHDIKLAPEQRKRIHAKQGGSASRKARNIETAHAHAQNLLGGLSRELVVAAAMLYWAEGSKGVCEFINSDGKMLQMYLKTLREILKVPEEQIKPTMRIFTGMDEKASLDYWSRVTSIPKNKFLVRLNDGGTRSRTQYGLCRITVLRGQYFLKLFNALIEGVFSDIITDNSSPRRLMDLKRLRPKEKSAGSIPAEGITK